MKLTPRMREALLDAAKHVEGLRRTHDEQAGKPSWPHPAATLHALVRHGLLEPRELRNRKGYRIQAWFITDTGRQALEPVVVVKRDTPLYLARGGGCTSNPKRSIDTDSPPDAIHLVVAVEASGPVNPAWRENAERNRRRARSDQNAARLSGLTHPDELARELKWLAAQRGRDIASELKRVELTRKAHQRAVRALERKVTGENDQAA
jgi:hypothetical protein